MFPLTWPIYYDIWALREPALARGDYLWEGGHRWDAAIADQAEILAALQVLAPGRVKGFLPVQSAFGDCCLYQGAIAGRGHYHGLQCEAGLCDHVPYHDALVRAGPGGRWVPGQRTDADEGRGRAGVSQPARHGRHG